MATQFCTTQDGIQIAYDVTGHGPALVLLHGGGDNRAKWHENGYVDRLKDDFTVITVDIRGNGDSDKPRNQAAYTIRVIADDILTVADACAVDRFGIWGFSLGGNVARYPAWWSERVAAIAVIGVPLYGPGIPQTPVVDWAAVAQSIIDKWRPLIEVADAGTLPDDTAEEDRQALERGAAHATAALFSEMFNWPVVEPGTIHCSTMLLIGTANEPVMAWLDANRQALEAEDVQLALVDGLDHFQEFTEVDKVLPVVSTFFKAHL